MIGFASSDHGRQPALPDMPLAEFFEKVYRPRRLPGGRVNTIRLYEFTFRKLERHLGRPPMVSDLNEETLCDFLEAVAKGHAPRTANADRDRLMAQARFAVLKGRLGFIPDLPVWPELRRVPKAYKLHQLDQLVRACAETPGRICGIPSNRYWLAVALVLYDTGCRAGACWALRRSDVDREERTVYFPAEYAKQKADQLLRMARDTLSAINAIWDYPRDESDLLFPWDFVPSVRYQHWRRILQRAGLPDDRPDMFHKLRRTTATICKRFGGDPTFQLGHTSDAITRKCYLDPSDEMHAADLMPRPWSTDADLPPVVKLPTTRAEVLRIGHDDGRAVANVVEVEAVDRGAAAELPTTPAAVERKERDPAPEILARIQWAANLIAGGLNYKAASIEMGMCTGYVKSLRQRYPKLLDLLVDAALLDLGRQRATAEVIVPDAPLALLGDDTARAEALRQILGKAAKLVYGGLSLRRAARALGRSPCAIARARQRNPELWAAAMSEAAGQNTPVNGVGPTPTPER